MDFRFLHAFVPTRHGLIGIQVPMQQLVIPVFIHVGKLLARYLGAALHECKGERNALLTAVVAAIT